MSIGRVEAGVVDLRSVVLVQRCHNFSTAFTSRLTVTSVFVASHQCPAFSTDTVVTMRHPPATLNRSRVMYRKAAPTPSGSLTLVCSRHGVPTVPTPPPAQPTTNELRSSQADSPHGICHALKKWAITISMEIGTYIVLAPIAIVVAAGIYLVLEMLDLFR